MNINNISNTNNDFLELKLPNAKTNKQNLENNVEKNDIENNDVILSENKIKNGIDVDDIQKYADIMGETLSKEDINYGLMFGRSVIVDYSA